jgi:hypothetical protein
MSKLRLALLVLPAVLVPAAASAQSTPLRELLKLSCTGDYLEHCSMHPPGGPEVEACFRQNLRKLSPDCARAIRTYQREKKSTR